MERVASEVTDILVGQIRDAMPRLVRAAIEVVGGRGAKSKIVVMSADSVKFVIGFEDLQIGATVRYDIGSDTYRLSPFVKRWNMQFNGAISTDFYVEDFSDVTKMKWIFERVMRMLPERGPGMEAREAKIVGRIVQAVVLKDRKDITRGELSRLLGGRRFVLRRVSFRGFGYGEAYALKVDGVPGGDAFSREVYEANKEIFGVIKDISENYSWMGLPIIRG